MAKETMKQDIAALEKKGWEVDDEPRALVKRERFESYDASVQHLVKIGKRAEGAAEIPSIRIDGGTEVTVRVGRPPSPGLTAAEIELAKSLDVG